MVRRAKAILEYNVSTEHCGLMAIHLLTHKTDKIKLRTAVQGVMKSMKSQVAKFRDQSEAQSDPVQILPKVLATRVRAALKLK